MDTLLAYGAGIVFLSMLITVELGIIYVVGSLMLSLWRNR